MRNPKSRRFERLMKQIGAPAPPQSAPGPISALRWFRDLPEEGDPACLCSLCLEVIPEFTGETDCDENGEYPCRTGAVRVWTKSKPVLEARFHDKCFEQVLQQGLIKLNHPGTKSGA